MSWFESYMDQSVTFTSWRKIEGKVCQLLKQNLEKKLMDPVHRQLLFQILGNDFVNKYFSSYTSSPAILDNVRREEKDKKMNEMKTLVASIIDGAVQKKGPKSDAKLQSDLSAFSEDIKKLIDSDFEDQFSEHKGRKKSKGDLPEKYLNEILLNDPNAINYMLPTLQSQVVVLSDLLRRQYWPACVVLKEKAKNVRNVDKVKERFLQLYNKTQYSEGRNDETKTIAGAVRQVYKDNQCLNTMNSEGNVNSTTAILNVCHSYGKKFQVQYIPYAIVMQQLYIKNSRNAPDEDYVMASMMTEKVLRLCMINMDSSNKIAEKVLQELNEVDKPFLNHINSTLSAGTKTGDTSSSSGVSSRKENTEASSYISNWILSGFVTFLKPHCMFLIWDQLFFHKWDNKSIHQVCIALLGLLKPWFMNAKQREEVQKVFIEEPGYLYTLDIRQALIHVFQGGRFSEIPGMNRNVIYDNRKKPPTPKPVIPPRVPTPPPPIPQKTFIPWVPYDKAKVKDVKITKSKLDFPFDLYIDAVRFVPDNATFIKVTGKVLNMYLGQKEKSIKFQIYPEMDSPWRYPDFKFKQTINKESIPMNPDVVIMMRVYTLEKHSKKNCVLGSCLFGPFSNKHGKQASLRTGGHQIRVRHGIPDPDFTVEHMLASHMDDNPLIPGVTILLRVLPHSSDYVSAPAYETNVYRSELAKPNESENKLYKHYQESKDISKTVRDITLLQLGQASANDDSLKQYIQQQLVKEGFDVEDFPYQRYVDYNKEHGIQVLADKASGLPIFLEGRYLQCLVQVFPGEDTKIGNGKNQVTSFVTEILELDSPQRAPDWSDQPKRIKPDYDDRAFILVSLYGLRPKYDSANQKIVDREGKDPNFNLQHAIAWSATTFFDKGSVFAGIHHIPLLKGRPPDEIIEKLSYLPLDYICKKFKTQVKVFEAASIELSVWDGHFINSECPPLPVRTDLLNISPNPQKYIKAAENPTGATVADLLKLGLNSPSEFSSMKHKLIEMLKIIFKNNLDTALTKAGFSSMI